MRQFRHNFFWAVLAIGLAGCSAGTERQADDNAPAVELASAPDMPVAIELFTSQGCSSCPPADRLVGELVDNPDLVIISRPVTYWDRLGWRDTLAREANTDLQRHYADRLIRGGGRAYTPQAVVGGRIGLVGSRRNELEAAIDEIGAIESDVAITVSGDADTGYRVTLNGAIADEGVVRLLALDSSETVSIGRGENTGRSVTYTNILRGERDLATWSGGSLALAIDPAMLAVEHSDRHAIVVRSGPAGPILAARYLDG